MESPFDGVLKRLGLSRPELSLLAGIHEGQIARVASGVVPTIPRRIKSTLEEFGVDIKALEEERRVFRETRVAELRKRMLPRRERKAV